MKTLIFGATGFLGELLTKKEIEKGNDVTAVARNEGKLIALKEQYPSIKIIAGDIANNWIVKKAFTEKPDTVFLLSAFKHVGMAEDQAMQCTRSNIVGTINVITESFIAKPQSIILTSTDKAAQVSGVYGATKLIGERLFAEAQTINEATKYRVVRYGNVLYSTGSVLCKWRDKIEIGEEVTITNQRATRFYWTREEAIEHLYTCLENATDATPWIPKMKAIVMGDLLAAMMAKYGSAPAKIIGLQKGENMHETMDGVVYSNEVEKYTQEEIMKRI